MARAPWAGRTARGRLRRLIAGMGRALDLLGRHTRRGPTGLPGAVPPDRARLPSGPARDRAVLLRDWQRVGGALSAGLRASPLPPRARPGPGPFGHPVQHAVPGTGDD